MEWATKRKIIYITGMLSLFGVIWAIVYYLNFYQAPSCFDGIQNQGEENVDCGGPCVIVCGNQIAQPIILWQRSFESTPSVYNAVAYVENTNSELGVEQATYRFTLYDDKNIFITERVGKTFIAPNEKFAVFEARFPVGMRIPKKTTFEFIAFTPWKKFTGERPALSVYGEQVNNADTRPRVSATMENLQLTSVKEIQVTAVVYDEEDNALASSATVVDTILPRSSHNLVFTWAQPFQVPPARVEIIPRVNPFVEPAP
jgi:hypothetical protein